MSEKASIKNFVFDLLSAASKHFTGKKAVSAAQDEDETGVIVPSNDPNTQIANNGLDPNLSPTGEPMVALHYRVEVDPVQFMSNFQNPNGNKMVGNRVVNRYGAPLPPSAKHPADIDTPIDINALSKGEIDNANKPATPIDPQEMNEEENGNFDPYSQDSAISVKDALSDMLSAPVMDSKDKLAEVLDAAMTCTCMDAAAIAMDIWSPKMGKYKPGAWKMDRALVKSPIEDCKAKNPMFCPYHGPRIFQSILFNQIRALPGLANLSTDAITVTNWNEDGEPDEKGKMIYDVQCAVPKKSAKQVQNVLNKFFKGQRGITAKAIKTDDTGKYYDISAFDPKTDEFNADLEPNQQEQAWIEEAHRMDREDSLGDTVPTPANEVEDPIEKAKKEKALRENAKEPSIIPESGDNGTTKESAIQRPNATTIPNVKNTMAKNSGIVGKADEGDTGEILDDEDSETTLEEAKKDEEFLQNITDNCQSEKVKKDLIKLLEKAKAKVAKLTPLEETEEVKKLKRNAAQIQKNIDSLKNRMNGEDPMIQKMFQKGIDEMQGLLDNTNAKIEELSKPQNSAQQPQEVEPMGEENGVSPAKPILQMSESEAQSHLQHLLEEAKEAERKNRDAIDKGLRPGSEEYDVSEKEATEKALAYEAAKEEAKKKFTTRIGVAPSGFRSSGNREDGLNGSMLDRNIFITGTKEGYSNAEANAEDPNDPLTKKFTPEQVQNVRLLKGPAFAASNGQIDPYGQSKAHAIAHFLGSVKNDNTRLPGLPDGINTLQLCEKMNARLKDKFNKMINSEGDAFDDARQEIEGTKDAIYATFKALGVDPASVKFDKTAYGLETVSVVPPNVGGAGESAMPSEATNPSEETTTEQPVTAENPDVAPEQKVETVAETNSEEAPAATTESTSEKASEKPKYDTTGIMDDGYMRSLSNVLTNRFGKAAAKPYIDAVTQCVEAMKFNEPLPTLDPALEGKLKSALGSGNVITKALNQSHENANETTAASGKGTVANANGGANRTPDIAGATPDNAGQQSVGTPEKPQAEEKSASPVVEANEEEPSTVVPADVGNTASEIPEITRSDISSAQRKLRNVVGEFGSKKYTQALEDGFHALQEGWDIPYTVKRQQADLKRILGADNPAYRGIFGNSEPENTDASGKPATATGFSKAKFPTPDEIKDAISTLYEKLDPFGKQIVPNDVKKGLLAVLRGEKIPYHTQKNQTLLKNILGEDNPVYKTLFGNEGSYETTAESAPVGNANPTNPAPVAPEKPVVQEATPAPKPAPAAPKPAVSAAKPAAPAKPTKTPSTKERFYEPITDADDKDFYKEKGVQIGVRKHNGEAQVVVTSPGNRKFLSIEQAERQKLKNPAMQQALQNAVSHARDIKQKMQEESNGQSAISASSIKPANAEAAQKVKATQEQQAQAVKAFDDHVDEIRSTRRMDKAQALSYGLDEVTHGASRDIAQKDLETARQFVPNIQYRDAPIDTITHTNVAQALGKNDYNAVAATAMRMRGLDVMPTPGSTPSAFFRRQANASPALRSGNYKATADAMQTAMGNNYERLNQASPDETKAAITRVLYGDENGNPPYPNGTLIVKNAGGNTTLGVINNGQLFTCNPASGSGEMQRADPSSWVKDMASVDPAELRAALKNAADSMRYGGGVSDPKTMKMRNRYMEAQRALRKELGTNPTQEQILDYACSPEQINQIASSEGSWIIQPNEALIPELFGLVRASED